MCVLKIVALVLLSFPVWGEGLSVIRDSETEDFVLPFARQAAKAAGLSPQNTQIVLINDDTINAFVAGGQTIFVHTGLLTHAGSPDDVMFVLAHETGHIKGGHVVRGQLAYEKMQTTALISTVLGGVLAAAAGQADVGLALMMGAQSSALGSFAHYRQTEESSADRIAVDIMNKAGYSLKGFQNIMGQIKAQERLNADGQGGYLRTHPLTTARINDLNRFLQKAPDVHQDEHFNRIKAKLQAFLYPPEQVLVLYAGSAAAHQYARAIAHYRQNNTALALRELDALIAKEPQNPYLYELKGQFLFETGQLDAAEKAYQQAVNLAPQSVLIKLALAGVLIEFNASDKAQQATVLLKTVLQEDSTLTLAWRFLASAYTQTGHKALADYAMAEYDYSRGDYARAKEKARRALKALPAGSKEYRKLDDILAVSTL